MRIEARLEVEREIGGHTFTGVDGEPDTTGGHLITVDILVSGEVTEEKVVLDAGLDLVGMEEKYAIEALWDAYVARESSLPYSMSGVSA